MKRATNMFHDANELTAAPTSVELKRVDPSLNMRRSYCMSLQLDLFGGVDLVREWGRIGCRGQSLIEHHCCEGEAVASMLALETAKRN